ncbi:MAG: hypothetical protein HY922_14970 [Elusimicrobia bacterium]|nr:hypothetical protein [Elusimicrobiota bacterium]
MKKAAMALLVSLCLTPAAKAERFSVTDKGGFGTTGRLVEFSSRFGWLSYEIKYDLSVDLNKRRLGENSKLEIAIHKNDGSRWRYRCRASSDDHRMWANINQIYGKGVQVMTECRLDPRQFSRSVDLNPEEVGEPTLVFAVRIMDGKAEAGVHKGLYFLGEAAEGGSMSPYMSPEPDPSNLGVIFNAEALQAAGRGPISLYVP